MVTLKKVQADEVYEIIHSYVNDNKVVVEDYDGMVNTILRMIKAGYCFTMDRDILRDAMECLTYMYTPSDDMNKDRVMQQFVDEDSDDESGDGEGGDDFGNMDLLRMMQMMGGQPIPPTEEGVVVKKEGESCVGDADIESTESKCKEGECVTGDCVDGECKLSTGDEVSKTDEDLIPERAD